MQIINDLIDFGYILVVVGVLSLVWVLFNRKKYGTAIPAIAEVSETEKNEIKNEIHEEVHEEINAGKEEKQRESVFKDRQIYEFELNKEIESPFESEEREEEIVLADYEPLKYLQDKEVLEKKDEQKKAKKKEKVRDLDQIHEMIQKRVDHLTKNDDTL